MMKVMTAILAIESGKLWDVVTSGEEVLSMYGSNIYVEYNESMLLNDLIYGLMMRSGNDAAVVIANYVADNEKEFVKMMNDKARELGMNNTVFNNPHGLDEETKNKLTASDMAKLVCYASKNETYRKIASTKYYIVQSDRKSYSWKNRADIVFSYNNLTSAKTGYTPRAKKVLATSASKDNINLAIVSFNNGYDYEVHKNMYEEIFDNYKKYVIVDKNKFNPQYGTGYLYVKNSFSYLLKDDEIDKVLIKSDVETDGGYLLVYLDDQIIYKDKIYMTKKINLWNKIKNFFNSLF